MHSVTVPLKDKLQQSQAVDSNLRLIAEWNHNRFSQIASVTNPGTAVGAEYDNDLFPLKSITDPERPTKGIVKAFSGTTGTPDGRTSTPYADSVTGARYVTSSADAKYKYWTSPGESASGSPYAITGVNPQVVYTSNVRANKIRVGLENSYASPSQYTVSVTLDGTNWTVVATNPAINSKGLIELYHQGAGVWSTTVNRTNSTNIRGVKLTVTNMAVGTVRFNLIELSARLEADLSTYVAGWTSEFSMSDVSFVAPIGKASSNTANVDLDNTDGIFSDNNAASPYYGLLDKNVELRMDIGINLATFDAPNYEYVRQFTMRTVDWAGQTREGTQVNLSDASEYLKSVKPNPFLYEQMSVGEIIWRLLDSVGFSYWQYDINDLDPSMLVPVFYSDGKESVWEIITQLAEVTQAAVWFDEYGVIQIMSRSNAYNLSKTVSWQFDAINVGARLADIESPPSVDYDFEANTVNISYTPTALSTESASGIRPMEVVWEPEETVTLRSSQLVKTMSAVDTSMYITPTQAKVWPYTGVVNLEGEFIKYTAKEYSYYLANGTLTKKFITSEDDRLALDKLNPNNAYKNTFTGRFQTLLANRGLWNTTPMLHDLSYTAWNTKRYRHGTGTAKLWAGGFQPQPNDSTLRLKTNSTFASNSWYVATLGTTGESLPGYVGTRMKFENKGQSIGGIVIAAGTNDSGIFVDFQSTEGLVASGRKYGHEVGVHARYSNGTFKRFGVGAQLNFSKGVWYDIDVKITDIGTSRVVQILVNGTVALTTTIPDADWPDSTGGRHGLYVRSNSSVLFEYFYSWSVAQNTTFDDATWWNRIYGGYQSNQYDKELVYDTVTQRLRSGSNLNALNKKFARRLEEFGPIIQEVREFEVEFSTFPAVYSQIYFSNESQIVCPEYNAQPFGASFVLANVSRENAVVSGEDTLTFGADNPVEQRFLIYGRTFEAEEDSRTYTVKNDQAIIRRGEAYVEIASKWIQSEGAAKKLGDWIVYHWSGGSDQVSLTTFGNPVLQLGDVVSINSPTDNMLPATHQYFVVGFSQSYNVDGMSTSFTLRRRKI